MFANIHDNACRYEVMEIVLFPYSSLHSLPVKNMFYNESVLLFVCSFVRSMKAGRAV